MFSCLFSLLFYLNPTECFWAYIDDSDQLQGPFAAKDMLSWYDQGYIQASLRVCGLHPSTRGVPGVFPSRAKFR
jgi:hypothetical protein